MSPILNRSLLAALSLLLSAPISPVAHAGETVSVKAAPSMQLAGKSRLLPSTIRVTASRLTPSLAKQKMITNLGTGKAARTQAMGGDQGAGSGDDMPPVVSPSPIQSRTADAAVSDKLWNRIRIEGSLGLPRSVEAGAEKIAPVGITLMTYDSKKLKALVQKMQVQGKAFDWESLNMLRSDGGGDLALIGMDGLLASLKEPRYAAASANEYLKFTSQLKANFKISMLGDKDCADCEDRFFRPIPASGIELKLRCQVNFRPSREIPTEHPIRITSRREGMISVNAEIGAALEEDMRFSACNQHADGSRGEETFTISCGLEPATREDGQKFAESFQLLEARTVAQKTLTFMDPSQIQSPVAQASQFRPMIVTARDSLSWKFQTSYIGHAGNFGETFLTYQDPSEVLNFVSYFLQTAEKQQK